MDTYRVNTMTMTAKTTISDDPEATVDLRSLYNRIGLDMDAGATAVIHASFRDADGVHRKGTVTKTNGRVKSFPKKLFDNQATIVVALDDGSNVNVKVFRNGNLQMTGARFMDSGRKAADVVLPYMSAAGSPPPEASRFRVCLMNADYTLPFFINRQKLYEKILESGLVCSYHPSIYPAVKTYYLYGGGAGGSCPARECCQGDKEVGCCKKVTVMVFYTGAVIITGATETRQIDAAFRWINGFVDRHKEDVADTEDVKNRVCKRKRSEATKPLGETHIARNRYAIENA